MLCPPAGRFDRNGASSGDNTVQSIRDNNRFSAKNRASRLGKFQPINGPLLALCVQAYENVTHLFRMVACMQRQHYRRPTGVPFSAEDRAIVTILLGGLTWKHEELLAAVLRGHGHPAETLPQPDRAAHEIGKDYCASGLCNPAYFVVGALIRRLRELEASGISRDNIVRRYAFLTAGSCGPCRYS